MPIPWTRAGYQIHSSVGLIGLSLSSKHFLPEGVFAGIKADHEAHDDSCLSLQDMWLGRIGGVSCASDLWDCSDCEVTFYLEGLSWINYEADDEDELYLCNCCATKRGVKTYTTPYGLSVKQYHA